jgi:hypothetical protein
MPVNHYANTLPVIEESKKTWLQSRLDIAPSFSIKKKMNWKSCLVVRFDRFICFLHRVVRIFQRSSQNVVGRSWSHSCVDRDSWASR